MADSFLNKIETIIYSHIEDEDFDVGMLSNELGLSRSQVLRKLKALTGKSVNQFIKEIRLKEAANLLQSSEMTASEIAYKVGFSSPSYFNKCFHQVFKMTPGEYKKEAPTNRPGLQDTPKNSPRNKRNLSVLISASVLICLVIMLVLKKDLLLPKTSNIEQASIAVLPLLDLSEDQDKDYLAVGITDAITLELSKQKDVRVISRGSAMRYKNTDKLYADIAKELDVDLLLEGSVLFGADSLRVVVQLIEPFPKEKHLWANNYHQNSSDILQLVHDISSEIAKEIDVVITPKDQKSASAVHPEAYNLYLKARHLWTMQNTQPLLNALDYLNQSIAVDSMFAPAYTLMAETYISLNKILQNDNEKATQRALARQALKRAFELDPENSDAYFTQANIHAKFDWDWEAMRSMAQKGLEGDPNNAQGHLLLSNYYLLAGKTVESLQEVLLAKKLDPLNPRTGCLLAERYYQNKEFDAAIQQYQKVLELYPNYGFAWDGIGYVYFLKGDKEDAKKSWQQLHVLMGNPEMVNQFKKESFEGAINFWLAQATSSDKPYCSNPSVVAEASMFVNHKELALEYLEMAYNLHNEDLPIMLLMPHFSPLYSEKRFQNLVKETGVQLLY